MKISRYKLSNGIFYSIISLSFLGYYVILLVTVSSGLGEYTRQVTIPIRLIIISALIIFVFLNYKKLKITAGLKWFLLFSAFFFIRIVSDFYFNEYYYLSTSELIFYFISFCVIPFVSISLVKLDEKAISLMINAIFFSGLLFSLLVVFSYGRFVGQVGRLASSTAGEDVISPLALSYCATLVIGTLLTYIFYNKVGKFKKLLILLTVALSTVPFFLGASRGSLLALFIPFLLMTFSGRSAIFIVNSMLGIIFFGVILYFLDDAFQSGLFTRFFGISDAVEQGSSSASRIEIWNASFHQFLNNPFFGDKLRVGNYNSYPHNIILEVLQTVGIIGFIPFGFLLWTSIKLSVKILKYYPSYSWLSVLFLQNLLHNFFSGAVFNAVWFWTSMAILFSVGRFLEGTSNKYIENRERKGRNFGKYEYYH